ncbi:MAG: hypothetical protein LBI54_01465 [Lachnospiraceae bacterium]|nr:hypothetical protein [Lachnospiraceae bacterium]
MNKQNAEYVLPTWFKKYNTSNVKFEGGQDQKSPAASQKKETTTKRGTLTHAK